MSLVARLIFKADGAAQVKRESDKVSRSVSESGKKVERSNKTSAASFGLVRTALGAVGVAAGADFVKNMVTGALSVQAAQQKAQNALKATGLTAAQQGAALQKYNTIAEGASTHGGGTRQEELAGLAQLTTLTGDSTKALGANAVVNKLAVGAQLSYGDALKMVSGAEAGRMRGLQRYIGIVTPVKTAEQSLTDAHNVNLLAIDAQAKAMGKAGPAWKTAALQAAGITKAQLAAAATADKNATAQKALAEVSQKYGHAQESMQQKLQDVRHSFQNLTDDLGKALLPTIMKVIRVADDFARYLAKHKAVVIALGVAITVLGTGILAGKLISGINAAKAGFLDLGRAYVAFTTGAEAESVTMAAVMDSALVSTGIGAIIVALGLLATHWKQVWTFMKTVFNSVVNFVKQNWKLLGTIILGVVMGPVAAAVFFIATHFKQVERVVTGVVHSIGHVFSTIFHAITAPFTAAINWVKSHAKYLNPMHYLGKAASFVGHALGSIGLAHGGPVYRAVGGPSGSDTVPAWLTPGEFVMPKPAVQQIGVPALQQIAAGARGGVGSQQSIVIEPAPVIIRLDSRTLAEGVAHFALKRAARGTSSTVGGPAVMGLGSA